ncbi:hypothetical protein BHYA_0284g00060 [Botrytis hyacinthi]|uniref:Uncharacterized protein n=1 Tax=Botrytis hyacinthi TaxID=278943 RepID=A0A4Z1GCN1_9HELO|nr:hypothetical protein BHYA_0284g00060 [Botrytis hyacinthi]
MENVDERDVKEVIEDDGTDAKLEEVVEEEMVDKVVGASKDKDREVEIVPEIKLEEDVENPVLVDDEVENVGGNTKEEEKKLPVLEVREYDEEVVDVLRDEAESEPNVLESEFRVTVSCEEGPDDRLPVLNVRLDEKPPGAILVVDVDTSVFRLIVADRVEDKLINIPDD